MPNRDPHLSPEAANVVGRDHNQPYTRRSNKTVFGFILVIFLVGAFVAWYFFSSPDDVEETSEVASVENTLPPELMSGNPYEEDTRRSGVYNFFYTMFGGIDDGLDDNPHNLDNVDNLDQFNLDSLGSGSAVSDTVAINSYIEAKARRNEVEERRSVILSQDEYRHSVYDVIGSAVTGRRGEKAGEVYDIMVHKETGNAKAIIVNDDSSQYDRDLTAVRFKKVLKQQGDGDVLLTVTEDTIEDKPEFIYQPLDESQYISLRHLRDGQLLDYQGKVTGQIDAIIYRDASAQALYFTLRPVLTQHGISKFSVPFEDINIIPNRDGFDVKLTKEQTEQLAEALFEESQQVQLAN